MKNKNIIVSDFDGTISTKDSLYHFFEVHAEKDWLDIEELWRNGKISSKECLTKEFELVPNLSKELIDNFTKTIVLDSYFKTFIENIKDKNYDFIIVSDGLDYFINSILENHGIYGIKIVSNHAEFINGKFKITFPNDYASCKNDAGTCKCKVVQDFRNNYNKIIYIGDGVSDFCVADKPDILFAKKSLLKQCKERNIKFIEYTTFKDVYSLLD